MAAGRECILGPLQPLGLYPANSIFVGGYSPPGQPPEEDYRMIRGPGLHHRPLTRGGGSGIMTGLDRRNKEPV